MIEYNYNESFIDNQFNVWLQRKNNVDLPEHQTGKPFITISREFGCFGYFIGDSIANIINMEYSPLSPWAAYNRELLHRVMDDYKLSTALAETLTEKARGSMADYFQTTFSKLPPQVQVYKKMAETIRLVAANGNCVMIGRGSAEITRNFSQGYRVRVIASMKSKISRVEEHYGVSGKVAEEMIKSKTKDRDNFIHEYIRSNPRDPHNYDLVINNSGQSPEETARVIIEGMKQKGLLVRHSYDS